MRHNGRWVLISLRLPALLPAVAYFVAASFSLWFTVHNGDVAFFWAATAIVIADLSDRPRDRWLRRLPAFLAANILANGLFGPGWLAGPLVGTLNLIEAVIAAHLLSSHRGKDAPLGSLAWLARFVIPVGMIAPAIVGSCVAVFSLCTGLVPLTLLKGIVGGHAFGNICFTPLVILVRRGGFRGFIDQLRGKTRREVALLLGLVLVVTTGVFMQETLPLLFLPILPLVLVSFRLGHGASGIAVTIVGVIGTVFTLAGRGPIHFIDAPLTDQLLFLEFFFACTVVTALPVAADLELRSKLHRQMRVSEARYRMLAEHSTDILMHMDVDATIRFVSPSIRHVAGFDPAELTGTRGGPLIDPSVDHVMMNHRAVLAACGQTHVFEYAARTKDGAKRCFEAHARAICDPAGRPEGVLSIIRDVSARKEIEAQLAEEAMTDPLTGLFNRRAFERAAFERIAGKLEGQVDCVAVFDIDHFKRVNDRFGHDAGDAVLGTFARVMRNVMRETDVVARTGGEEFAVLLANTSVEQALTVCDRLRVEMSAMETLCAGARVRVTVSGGVAVLGEHGLDRALREADQALYAAKRGGRDQMTLAA